jgi:hypothetical protein
MTWLIIILILVIVIGPVMYLVPTAADKRLTGLRAEARRLGLNVQVTSVPKLDPSSDERVTAGGKRLEPRIQCAAYHLMLGENLANVGQLQLLKLPAQPTVLVNEVAPGWALQQDSDAAFWQRYNAGGQGVEHLLEAVALLPVEALGIAISPRSVSCYWRERAEPESGAVDAIAAALKLLRDDLIERF